jgi:D-hydroxyproline dehydrogenase subunit gamma
MKSPSHPAALLKHDDCRLPAYERGAEIKLVLDGLPLACYEGETVAAALLASGLRRFRVAPDGTPRGPYCGIGLCFDCLMEIEGQPGVRACQTPVRDGMKVAIQVDVGHWQAAS